MTDDSQAAAAADDGKRQRILQGAQTVFLAYGFQRTTMDDIARAADMSRPALYLAFKNKTDIYRAITALHLETAITVAGRELGGEGSFGDRLARALEASIIAMMQEFQASPHGAEILDMKNSLAGDLIAGWKGRLGERIADAIMKEAERLGSDLHAKGLTPRTMAELFLDGLEGMKMRVSDPSAQREGLRQLVRMLDLSIRA